MKRLIYILSLLIILTVNVKAFEIVPIDTSNIYCQDYIGVLNDETKNYLLEKGSLLEEKTKAQIVIVTKNDIDANIYDYSYELFNSLGIGDSSRNNGILLLFTTDTKEYQMIVGSGIDSYFTIDMCNAITDGYFKDEFVNGRFDQAAVDFYDACFTELSNYYKVEYSKEIVEEKDSWFKKVFNSSNMIIGLIALVISAIITLSVFIYNRIKHITIKPNSFIEKGGNTNQYQNQYNRGYYQRTASYSKKSTYTNTKTAKVHSSYGGGKSKGIGSKH